jgi:hypothetical protein
VFEVHSEKLQNKSGSDLPSWMISEFKPIWFIFIDEIIPIVPLFSHLLEEF